MEKFDTTSKIELTKEIFEEAQLYSEKVCDGLTKSASPFHSVATIKSLLDEGGFEEISEQ